MKSYLSELNNKHEDSFFFKHFYFTELLPKEQSHLLSYLIAMEEYCKIRLADDNSYFECNVEGFISNKLFGWSNYEIKSALNNLVNAGFIYKRVINNNSTFIALNHSRLDKLYSDWQNAIEKQVKNQLTVTLK